MVRHQPDGLLAGEIARRLDVPQNTMSAHLAILARAGLVRSERHTLVARLVGVAILLFVILKATGMIAFKPSRRVLVIGDGVTGLLSGLVGSAGLLGAAVFLSLGLPPLAYVASDAVASIAMHGVKTIVYGATIDLGSSFWPLAIAMGLAMIAGTWTGRLLIKRLPVERFRQLVMVLRALIAIEMIVMG